MLSHQSGSTLTHGLQPARHSQWEFSRKNTGVGCYFPGASFDPGIRSPMPASPALAGGSYHCATWCSEKEGRRAKIILVKEIILKISLLKKQ